MEILWIASAMLCGLLLKHTGLPPLLGYLAAGFTLVYAEQQAWIPHVNVNALSHFAHAGVLLLLFTIGLKIKVNQLIRPEIIGTSVLHLLGSMLIFTPVLIWGFDASWMTAAILSCALSFSSTVLAAKSLDDKKELRAFHGQIAIGILVIQDLFAMGLLSMSSGNFPSIYAAALVFLALPQVRSLIGWVLARCGHDDLLLLCGILFALAGGALFGAVGLSAELGALVFGALCAAHDKSSELNEKLWGIKELFLIAFFLTIGLKGLPSSSDLIFALSMVALLPIQFALFFFGLLLFKMKARNAFLTAISLTTFSEFSLIVASVALVEWVLPLAMALTLSFILAAPLNKYAHQLFDKLEPLLLRFERGVEHPDEEPFTLGHTKLLILGMGRIGQAAFRAARSEYQQSDILGLDADPEKVKKLAQQGYNVQYADAEHTSFWFTINTNELDAVIVATECYEAAFTTITQIRLAGFSGTIVAHSRYADNAKLLEEAGANHSYVTMDEAGKGLFSAALLTSKTECYSEKSAA